MRKCLRFFVAALFLGLFSFSQACSQCVASDVIQPTNQEVKAGSNTAPINFTSTVSGTSFKWTNDNTLIGLGASGTGNIPSFTALNSNLTTITANVTVTPYNGTTPYAYIPNYNNSNVSVVNINTGAVVKTIPISGSVNPLGVTSSPDGSKVYVGSGLTTVYVINTATNTVSGAIGAGNFTYGMVVSPDGSKLYIGNYTSNTVKVVNTSDNTVITTITVGSNPYGMVVSPDGSKLYVANGGSNNISVINTTTNTVSATINTETFPFGVALSPDGSRLYVSNNSSNSVSVINTATNTVSGRVTVGSMPSGVSISPDGSKLYVANRNSNNVSVINTTTNTVSATIPVGTTPIGTAISPDGSKVIVANEGSHNVSVINVATNTISATVAVGTTPEAFGNAIVMVPCPGTSKSFSIIVNPVPDVADVANQSACAGSTTTAINFTGSVPGTTFKWENDKPSIGLAARGTGNVPSFTAANTTASAVTASIKVTPYYGSVEYAYIANTGSGSNNVSVINTANNSVVTTIPVGGYPYGAAVSSDGTRVYVANYLSDNISVINTATNTVTNTIQLTRASGPVDLVVSPDGTKVYVTNNNSTTISVINTADNTVSATITVGSRPDGIVITPDGSKLYVVNYDSGTVSVITTADNQVIKTINVGAYPRRIVMTADGSKVYVMNFNSKIIPVITTADNNVATTITLPNYPTGIAISPDGSKLYIPNYNGPTYGVYVITTSNNTIVKTVPTSKDVGNIAVSPDGSKLYVTSSNPTNLLVVNTADYSISEATTGGDIPILYSSNIFSKYNAATAGAAKTFNITVNTLPAVPTISYSGSTTICEGSSLRLMSSSTTGNQWYKDDALISGATGQTYNATTSGTYTVKVTNSCGTTASTASVAITVNLAPAAPTVTTSSATTFCSGGSVVLTSSATTGNQWFNGSSTPITGATGQTYTATTSGNYNVRVLSSCGLSAASATVDVTVKFKPAIPLITVLGNTLTSSATTGNQWYLNNTALAGATAQTYNVQEAGPYTVQVTQDGCMSTSAVHNFVPTRIEEPAAWNGEVVVYPNPVEKVLTVKNTTGHPLRVQLYNNLRQNVYDAKLVGTQSSISVEGLPRGAYQLMITDLQKGKSISQTILKQ